MKSKPYSEAFINSRKRATTELPARIFGRRAVAVLVDPLQQILFAVNDARAARRPELAVARTGPVDAHVLERARRQPQQRGSLNGGQELGCHRRDFAARGF